MKRNSMTVCIALFLSTVLSAQQVQKNPKVLESEAMGPQIKAYLTHADEKTTLELSKTLLKDDKPIPALAVLKILGEKPSEAVRAQSQACNQRIEYLKTRSVDFKNRAMEKGDEKALCSFSAIYFHAGFTGKSLKTLQGALAYNEKATETSGLFNSLRNEIALTQASYNELYPTFEKACGEKEQGKALDALCQMLYIGIYSGGKLDCIDLFRQSFPVNSVEKGLKIFEEMPQELITVQGQWEKS